MTKDKHATDRHNKMFLRLEAALERALEDPAQMEEERLARASCQPEASFPISSPSTEKTVSEISPPLGVENSIVVDGLNGLG